MTINRELIKNNYKNTVLEDNRSNRDCASHMEFYYTEKIISEYISQDTTVIELGCGTGYYGMYLANKCKAYLGIDITPENIDVFNSKVASNGFSNLKAKVGDATNLNFIEDKSYDVVLVLGPMYHLPPEEREFVFEESKRICKDDGIIIYAYINKIGAYLKGIFLAPSKYPDIKVNEVILDKGVDDIRPDVFFYSMPEEIERAAINHQLHIVKNVGINFTFNPKAINDMTEKQLEAWMVLTDFMSNSPSCTGVSIHALLICKKIL